MFKLRTLLILFALAGAIVLLPAANVTRLAQAGGMWSAWLYKGSPDSNELIRIYQDGTIYETELPIPQGGALYGTPAFNDDGELAAYCVLDPQAGQISLHVQGVGENAADVAAAHQMTLPFVYELGGVMACEGIIFNETDNAQVAVTLINYFPGDPKADTSLAVWELYVMDLKTGTVAHVLTAGEESINALMLASSMTFVPMAAQFGSTLIFRMMPYGIGGPIIDELEAFEWDIAAGSIRPNAQYRQAMLALYTPVNAETGEITGPQEAVWPVLDDTLPVTQPNIPMPPLNAVMYDSGSGAPYPIYQLEDTSLMLGAATFVAGGRYVALALPSPSGESTIWRALGRDGALLDLPIAHRYVSFELMGAPQGYAFLDTLGGVSRRLVYHTIDEDGTVTESVLWEDAEPSWTALWSAPVPGTAGLPPFPPVQ